MLAAYRDRYRITDDAPLGASPASEAQKIDMAAVSVFLAATVAGCGGLAAPTVTATPSAPRSIPAPTPTKAATTAPALVPVPASYQELDERGWSLVAKDPEAVKGNGYVVYGNVTQFDTITGTSTFRANVAGIDTTEYGFFTGDNTMLVGTPEMLAGVAQKDVFRANVTAIGSYSYENTMGGTNTTPLLRVDSIEVIGRTDM